MIVYRDLISGDEMMSDAFKLQQVLDDEKNPVSLFVDSPIAPFGWRLGATCSLF